MFGTDNEGDKLRHIPISGSHQARGCWDSAKSGGKNKTLYFDQDRVTMVTAYTLCLTGV